MNHIDCNKLIAPHFGTTQTDKGIAFLDFPVILRRNTSALFRVVFGMLFFLSINVPSNHLSAQASLLQSWTNFYNGTSNSQNIPYTISAGTNTNRLLVVAVTTTLTAAATNRTISLTYGGRALTLANGDLTSNAQQHTAIYYLDEAGLDLASSTTLAFTATNRTTRVNMIWAAVYDFVNQTTPINDSKNYNSGSTTTSSFRGESSQIRPFRAKKQRPVRRPASTDSKMSSSTFVSTS
jgi:hypothetical protein